RLPEVEHRGRPAADHGADAHPPGRGRRVRHLAAGRGDRTAVRRTGGGGGDSGLRSCSPPGAGGTNAGGDGGVYQSSSWDVPGNGYDGPSILMEPAEENGQTAEEMPCDQGPASCAAVIDGSGSRGLC